MAKEPVLKLLLAADGGFSLLHIKTGEQPEKASSPMLVTLLGMVTEVRLLQSRKASEPMLVTLFGMVTEVRPRQYWKALSPMLVTLLGMVTEVRLLHL